YSELLQAPEHYGCKFAAAVFGRGTKAIEKSFVLLRALMHHARVDRRCQQVVRRGDRMDIARKMEIEFLHGDDLAITSACRAALDSKRRALAGLADASEHLLPQVRSERLA